MLWRSYAGVPPLHDLHRAILAIPNIPKRFNSGGDRRNRTDHTILAKHRRPLGTWAPEIGARGRIQTGVIRGLQSRAYSLCHSCIVFIWQQCQDLNLKYVSQSHVCCQLHHTAIFNWSWRVGLNHQHRFYENRILPIKLLHGFGAGGENRTHNIWDLNPARLPIAPHLLKLVASPRFELGKSCF